MQTFSIHRFSQGSVEMKQIQQENFITISLFKKYWILWTVTVHKPTCPYSLQESISFPKSKRKSKPTFLIDE